MSTKTVGAQLETNADNLAGEVVSFDQPSGESNIEGPPSINTGDFEYDVGDIVELPPPEAASPFERIIEESDLLPVGFLKRGVEIQQAVARVVLTRRIAVCFRGADGEPALWCRTRSL